MQYLNKFKDTSRKINNFMQVFDNCVKHHAVDKLSWDTIYNQSPKLQKINKEGKKIFEKYITVMQDFFYLLTKIDPEYIDDRQMDNITGFINKQVMEHLKNVSSYEDLRSYTVGNDLNAAITIVELSDELHEKVKELAEELKKKQEELEKQMQELAEAIKNAKSDDDLTDEQKQQIMDLSSMLEDAMNIDVDLGQIAEAMEHALNEAQANEETMVKWGLQQNDTFMKLPYKNKLKTFERLQNSDRLHDIADMLGNFQKLLSEDQATKVNQNISNADKITKSNEIEMALPTELTRLADEDMELLFLRDFANHDLDTYEYEYDVETIKGPIVIAIDESGSMSGHPEIWSKACALAVIHQAQVENRSVFVIHFAHHYSAAQLAVHHFPKDKHLDINEMIDMAEHFYNGGTSFDQPLERMMQCVDTEDGFETADGLFITDGWCNVNPDIMSRLKKFKEEKNFKLLGIQIGGGGYGSNVMDEFCNKTWKLNELSNELFLEVNSHLIN